VMEVRVMRQRYVAGYDEDKRVVDPAQIIL